jgi:hypothetical protein
MCSQYVHAATSVWLTSLRQVKRALSAGHVCYANVRALELNQPLLSGMAQHWRSIDTAVTVATALVAKRCALVPVVLALRL